MQSGSIGGSSPYSVNQQYSVGSTNKGTSVPVNAVVEENPSLAEAPKERVTLAARFNTTAESLETEDQGDGNLKSKMTIALVPQKDQAHLEKQGVIFPEIEEVRSNQGLSPDGRLELVPVDGTGNPETTHILQTLEVNRNLLEKDAAGKAPIDGYFAQLIPNGSTVIPKGYFGVPDGTQVAPQGYEFKLSTSAAGAKTEAKRLRLNRISDASGTFAQSSLAGIMKIPYFSAAAPFIALATAGTSLNKHYSDLKDAQDTLGYVESREKLSKTDQITLEIGVGSEVPVSAKAERQRVELKVRQAKSKLLSTSLLAASGGASVVGWAAAGGAFGAGGVAAALTGAIAATPYLAGAAMIVSSGGMVVNSLSQLKTLSKEKAELQALLASGETHSTKTIERVSPQLGRPVAIGEQQVPIDEQLKTITKEQRKHRLLATAMSGGLISVGATVGLGVGALAVAPLALAPAGVVAAGQSIAKLKELSKEKSALVELHKTGATMVDKQTERQDGSWSEEKIPISTLLRNIETQQNKHKLILTAVGSAGAVMGMTLGAGLSFMVAAPILLLPAIIGAAMFPEKVKEFASKVAGFVAGKFGEEGRSRKDLVKDSKEQTAATKELLIGDLDALVESDSSLFYVPSKAELKAAKAEGRAPRVGYFTQLNQLMDAYAGSGSRAGRFQAMQRIESFLAQAPPNAQPSIAKVKERLGELHMNTEAAWVARDVRLEMKTDTTGKVLADDRVKSRVGELGFPTDTLEAQYEETLKLENSEQSINELLGKSRSGDRDASLQLARKEVFGAARLYYQSQEELGSELLAKLVDAIQQPEKAENLERVVKEVNNKLGRPMAPSTAGPSEKWWLQESTAATDTGFVEPLRLADFQGLASAVATLEKPLDISQAGQPVDPATSPVLEGPQARMAQAFRELHGIDSKAADELGQAFAATLDFEGVAPEQAQQKRLEGDLALNKAKDKFTDKAPELIALWDSARKEVEEEYFQRSVDPEFAANVLARPEVAEAAQRLGVSPEDVKVLYSSFLRSEVTGNSRPLQGQLVDGTGQQIDPAKAELLEVLDRSMASVAAEMSGGANDTVVTGAELGKPDSDPQIATFLEANPVIGQVLGSDQLIALASQLQVPPEEARTAYLTLVQANLNPVMTAEFDGLYAGGDLNAVKTFQIANEVGALVKAATTPPAEVVAQQIEQGMQGPVVAAVLNHPEIQTLAENLKVDTQVLMRTLLQADLSGDKAPIEALAQRAQEGDAIAQAEMQMIQTLAQATLQVAGQVNTQAQSAEMPQAA